MNQERLAQLPAVGRLLQLPELQALLCPELPAPLLHRAVREAVSRVRRALLRDPAACEPAQVDWVKEVRQAIAELRRTTPRRVLNATGVVIHTNLGRVPLAARAVQALTAVASSYSDLEYDLAQGQRSSRHGHAVPLLRELTGAEDALVVNNNAAAVLLAASGLASGGEVVISRGELVEIGGSFRIPDVIRQGGARLVEVGTTNRTHLSDYAAAITPATRLLLKVHRSNFVQTGFTTEVERTELVTLGREHGIPVMEDLGSGCLIDFPPELGLHEPTVPRIVAAGLDLVTFSGDKLVGGPQAGILVGRRALLDRLRHHPLLRAVRPGKLTLAALVATLSLYREGREQTEIPVLRLLLTEQQELRERTERFAATLRERSQDCPAMLLRLRTGQAPTGGGALPSQLRPTTLLLLSGGSSPDGLLASLRQQDPPVIARIVEDAVALDLSCIREAEEEELLRAVIAAFQRS